MKTALEPIVDTVFCPQCKEGIQQTIKSLIAAWVGIKVGPRTSQYSHVPNHYFYRPRYNNPHGPEPPMYTIPILVATTRGYHPQILSVRQSYSLFL